MALKTKFQRWIQRLAILTSGLGIRWRLTLLFVFIFGATLVLISLLSFDFVSQALQKEFDDALYNYAVDVSESVTLNSSGDLAVITPEVDKQKIYPFSLGTALIQIRSINGDIITQVGDVTDLNIPFKNKFKRLEKGEDVNFESFAKNGEVLASAEADSFRVVNFPIDNSPVPQLILQVAVPMTFLQGQIRTRKFFIELLIPIILVVATAGGYFLSTRALKPVTEIITKAHEIEAGNLSERLPVPRAKDEVHYLAKTLNEMLERIEGSFRSQERFVADASHQLLTPLSIMKGEMEAHLKMNSNPVLHSALQEVEHLISLVKNMLLLARVDAGIAGLQLSEVFFEELVLECIARAEKVAKPKNVKITFNMRSELPDNADRPRIKADEDLLINAIFNLIENAVKYSPNGEVVAVELWWKAGSQILSIRDHGPGLPKDKKDLIFQRFSRGTQIAPGHGLGLAIAQKIAELHSTIISAVNNVDINPQNQDEKGCLFQFEMKNI